MDMQTGADKIDTKDTIKVCVSLVAAIMQLAVRSCAIMGGSISRGMEMEHLLCLVTLYM